MAFSQQLLTLNDKLSKLDPDKKSFLLAYLSDEMLNKLNDPSFPESVISVDMTIDKIIQRTDISHFKEALKMLSEGEKNLTLAAFPEIKQVLLTDEERKPLSLKSKKFADHILKGFLKKALSPFPPPKFLPYHITIELLSDSGIKLSELIHYLGLLDVSLEIKKIISQKKLKQLQSLFDLKEIEFMNKEASNDRPPLSLMGLVSFDGDKEKLTRLINNRGLYRFVQGIKRAPAQYRFFFTYFLPKHLSDKMNHLLRQKPQYALSYRDWETDTLNTWRFLCTYSK